jgi:hypothetical protein
VKLSKTVDDNGDAEVDTEGIAGANGARVGILEWIYEMGSET